MNKRSKRFQPIQRLARHSEDQAAQRLGKAQQQLSAQEQRLRELTAYRDEYAQQFHLNGQAGLDGRQLQSYQSFLNQLNAAIEQQKQQILQAQEQRDARRTDWHQQHTHSEVLASAVKRIKTQEQHSERRQEQRNADEQALRRREPSPSR
ncbi:MAG: flagellar export protein FliJ [Gammaproteobacteria bacterium]